MIRTAHDLLSVLRRARRLVKDCQFPTQEENEEALRMVVDLDEAIAALKPIAYYRSEGEDDGGRAVSGNGGGARGSGDGPPDVATGGDFRGGGR